MLETEWKTITGYIGQLWPKAEMTETELGLLRRAIESRNLRNMSARNYADCLDAERLKSKTHKPSLEALIESFCSTNAKNAAIDTGEAGGKTQFRVDIYRRAMGGVRHLDDVGVLADHCRNMERGGFGTDYAMAHFADCLDELGMMQADVLDMVAQHFGVAGQGYRSAMAAKRAEAIKGATKRRADHQEAKSKRVMEATA